MAPRAITYVQSPQDGVHPVTLDTVDDPEGSESADVAESRGSQAGSPQGTHSGTDAPTFLRFTSPLSQLRNTMEAEAKPLATPSLAHTMIAAGLAIVPMFTVMWLHQHWSPPPCHGLRFVWSRWLVNVVMPLPLLCTIGLFRLGASIEQVRPRHCMGVAALALAACVPGGLSVHGSAPGLFWTGCAQAFTVDMALQVFCLTYCRGAQRRWIKVAFVLLGHVAVTVGIGALLLYLQALQGVVAWLGIVLCSWAFHACEFLSIKTACHLYTNTVSKSRWPRPPVTTPALGDQRKILCALCLQVHCCTDSAKLICSVVSIAYVQNLPYVALTAACGAVFSALNRSGWSHRLTLMVLGPPSASMPLHNALRWHAGYSTFAIFAAIAAYRLLFLRDPSRFLGKSVHWAVRILFSAEMAEDALTWTFHKFAWMPLWQRLCGDYYDQQRESQGEHSLRLVHGPSVHFRRLPFLWTAGCIIGNATASLGLMCALTGVDFVFANAAEPALNPLVRRCADMGNGTVPVDGPSR